MLQKDFYIIEMRVGFHEDYSISNHDMSLVNSPMFTAIY